MSEERLAQEIIDRLMPAVEEKLVNAKKHHIEEVFKGLMEKYGFDVNNPLESQKDQAHNRASRIASESFILRLKMKSADYLVAAGMGGLAAYLLSQGHKLP